MDDDRTLEEIAKNNEEMIKKEKEMNKAVVHATDDSRMIYDAERDTVPDAAKPVVEPEPKTTEQHMVYDAETDDEKLNDQEPKPLPPQPDSQPDEDLIDENQKNVFDNGLQGGQHIRLHNCPMCGIGKKSINELYTKKFMRPKQVIGYASICANCGFTSFYTTNLNEILKYFRGSK